jgi:phage baseplate assembly protein W
MILRGWSYMANDFLGRGWKFPVKVDSKTGRIMTSEYEEDISEAIRIIIGTSKGERIMRANFGCDIKKFVFDMTDDSTLRLMESSIHESIVLWEPRVEEVEVSAEADKETPGKVDINIGYVVRATNNLFNLVYPFYMNEGNR